MDVVLPSGVTVKNVPDDMSKEEFVNTMIARGEAQALGGTKYSPTEGTGIRQQTLEGIGKTFTDLAQGVKQRLGMATEQDVADKRAVDAPLMQTTGGKIGAIGGGVAATAPTFLIPGINTMTGAALSGGAYGALQPTAQGESVTKNAMQGAIWSVAGQAAAKALTGFVQNRNTPSRQALVDTAKDKYGIELTAGAQTGSKPLQYLESQIAASPGGGRMADTMQKGSEQYTQAVMKRAGGEGLATEAGMAAAKQGAQDAYKSLWSRNTVKVDNQMVDDLIAAEDMAARMLTPEKQRIVAKQIDNVLAKVQNGEITGNTYQMALRPELRSVIKSDSSLYEPLRRVQQALDEAAMRSIGPKDAAALKDLNRQYAVQKKLTPAMQRAEARGGTLAPSDVMVKSQGMGGDIGELAKIGTLLREPPQSGTVPRLLAQGLLGGATGLYGYQQGGLEGALAGAAAGIAGPMLGAQALSSPIIQRLLVQGLLGGGAAGQQTAGAVLRTAGMQVPQAQRNQ